MCFCGRALHQCVCLCFMQQKHIKGCQALLAAPSGFTIKDIIKLKNTYKHFIISTFSFIWAAAWIPAVCCRGWRAASRLVFSYNPEVWGNPGPPGPRGGRQGADPDYSMVTKLHRSQETFWLIWVSVTLWWREPQERLKHTSEDLLICSYVFPYFPSCFSLPSVSQQFRLQAAVNTLLLVSIWSSHAQLPAANVTWSKTANEMMVKDQWALIWNVSHVATLSVSRKNKWADTVPVH